MTRQRLRASRLSGEEESQFYSRTYPDGYQHDRWPDHVERIRVSADLIERHLDGVLTAADLSCGDGALLNMVSRHLGLAVYGDLNGPPVSALVSSQAAEARSIQSTPLPDSLASLPDGGVDLFILSETLEHLDDPDSLLSLLTGHARRLFVSTPVDEQPGSGNQEHYWGWGKDDVQAMLVASGWHPLEAQVFTPESTRHMDGAYTFQLWMAERACDPE